MFLVYLKHLIKLLYLSILGRYFWNYRLYSKYARDQNNLGALKLESIHRFAIVIQGPIISNQDFTAETIKLYRRNFPDAIIILSTWFVSDNMIKMFNEDGVHVTTNQKPENPGISNINLQIITSAAGVLEAARLGAQFVLKTRTDQRIYHPSLDAYLSNLLKVYPVTSNFPGQGQRLVTVSLGTFKYRLYGVSDMFLYGHIDDMVRYWNIPLDERIDSLEERRNAGPNTWRTYSMWRTNEVYLSTEYLKSIGRSVDFTLADSLRVFRDHFLVIDQAALKLYWHKYTLNAERYTHFDFFDSELSFNDWLILYNSIDDIIIEESILDNPV